MRCGNCDELHVVFSDRESRSSDVSPLTTERLYNTCPSSKFITAYHQAASRPASSGGSWYVKDNRSPESHCIRRGQPTGIPLSTQCSHSGPCKAGTAQLFSRCIYLPIRKYLMAEQSFLTKSIPRIIPGRLVSQTFHQEKPQGNTTRTEEAEAEAVGVMG